MVVAHGAPNAFEVHFHATSRRVAIRQTQFGQRIGPGEVSFWGLKEEEE
jgi:hypothetical protein